MLLYILTAIYTKINTKLSIEHRKNRYRQTIVTEMERCRGVIHILYIFQTYTYYTFARQRYASERERATPSVHTYECIQLYYIIIDITHAQSMTHAQYTFLYVCVRCSVRAMMRYFVCFHTSYACRVFECDSLNNMTIIWM